MEDRNASRVKLLKVWEILTQETDIDNPISTNALLERLLECGIDISRKTLYRDIELLIECGYDILCERGRENFYYTNDRPFEVPEIQMILDAVHAASFISDSQEQKLIDKVSELAGRYKGEVLKKNITRFEIRKNPNNHLLYNLNNLIESILDKKKAAFQYFDYVINHKKSYRKDEQEYIVSPLATVYSEDKYYLVTYDEKREKLVHYRIDRMENVRVLDERISYGAERKRNELSMHKSQVFGMYSGEKIHVTIEVDESLLNVVYDRFGENLNLNKKENGKYYFNQIVQESPVFYGWICSLGTKIKVVSPVDFQERIGKYMKEVANLYSNEDNAIK